MILTTNMFQTNICDWFCILFISEISQFLVEYLFPPFTTDGSFQQPQKQDSFRHILKSSATMCKSSDPWFFTTTIGLESGPDPFEGWL